MNRLASFVAAVLLAFLPLTGCLFRTRKVEIRPSTAPLLSATQQDLIERANQQAAQIQTLNATVDIAPAVGGEKKGKVTEYREISGYILLRKPAMLRMIGLFPIVRTRAFDMVSNGKTFELWIPAKNKFYLGRNDLVPPGKTGLETLRPDVMYDALLVGGIDENDEIAVLEPGVQTLVDANSHKPVHQADYRLDVIEKGPLGWRLGRKIFFSRIDLRVERQLIYDQKGNIATDAHYSQYKNYNGVSLPSVIEIIRPQEEYDIKLTVVKLTLNQPLTNEQFALAQPPSAQVIHLDQPGAVAQDGTQAPPTPKE